MLARAPTANLRPVASSKAHAVPLAGRIVAQASTSGYSHAATTSHTPARIARHADMRCHASARPSVFLFGFGGGQQQQQEDDFDDESYTVMKLQVGVFGDISKWQADLERLSTLYDTDDEGALHAILQEVLATLLRRAEYISYVSSGGKLYDTIEEAEAKFNEVSFEERSKMGDETLTNVNGLRRQDKAVAASNASPKDLDQWLCVTLVLAVERGIKLPKITSIFELKKAITLLAGVHEEELLAFELMWTPQDAGDSYSKDELLMDYPKMITLA